MFEKDFSCIYILRKICPAFSFTVACASNQKINSHTLKDHPINVILYLVNVRMKEVGRCVSDNGSLVHGICQITRWRLHLIVKRFETRSKWTGILVRANLGV